MSIRPSDEIVLIHAVINSPMGGQTEMRIPRVGHVFILDIGSGENCKICHESLANFHASIELYQFSAYIINHDAVNGTLINGLRIHDRTKLRSGDELICGELTIDIVLENPNLDGKGLKLKRKTEYCIRCHEPWVQNPLRSGCLTYPHWEAYVNYLEAKNIILADRVTGLETEKKAEFGGQVILSEIGGEKILVDRPLNSIAHQHLGPVWMLAITLHDRLAIAEEELAKIKAEN